MTDEQMQAALAGAGTTAVAELLQWQRENNKRNADDITRLKDRVRVLENKPAPELPPQVLAELVTDPALDAALNIASTAAGAWNSSNLAVNTTTCGSGSSAQLYNPEAGATQKTKFHRIRISPAGSPASGGGDAVVVSFPQALSKIPTVRLNNSSAAANQHLAIISAVTKAGYTLAVKGTLTASVTYDFDIEVDEY